MTGFFRYQILSKPGIRFLVNLILIIGWASFVSVDFSSASAQVPTERDLEIHRHFGIPPKDTDLDDLIKKAKAIRAFAERCIEMECPQLDCKRAYAFFHHLDNAQSTLDFLANTIFPKLNKDELAAWNQHVEDTKISAGLMQNAQNALAWQRFLGDFSSNMTSIAGVIDFVKELSGPPKTARGKKQWQKMQDDLTANEAMKKFDKLYEALKDLEGGMDNMSQHISGKEGTGTPMAGLTPESVVGIPREDINKYKSTASNIKNTIDIYNKEGKNWKRALRKGGAAELGQVLARHLQAYNEELIKERQKRIDSYARNMAASERILGKSYDNLVRIRQRRYKLEDALNSVRRAASAFRKCMELAECKGYTISPSDFNLKINLDDEYSKIVIKMNHEINKFRYIFGLPLPTLKDDCSKRTGLYLGLRSSTGVPVNYSLPGIFVEGVRNEDCTLNPVNDPVVIMPQPGDVPIEIVQDPPLPLGIPDFPELQEEEEEEEGEEEEEPSDIPVEPVPDEPSEKEKDETPPVPPAIYIVKTQATVLEGNKKVVKLVQSATIKISLNPDPQLARGDDEGFDEDPLTSITDNNGNAQIAPDSRPGTVPGSGTATITLDVTPMDGNLLHMGDGQYPLEGLHPELLPYVRNMMNVDGERIVVLLYPRFMGPQIADWLEASDGIELSERDLCKIVKTTPNDPYFSSKGSWNQEFEDQWAIKRVGFTAGSDSAWSLLGDNPSDVVVAVVDTGIDWNHRDLSWDSIWKNTNEIPDNGIDDDANGFVDDIIGWDFIRDTNKPWDRSGHGTFISGIIAADTNNGIGIAGINPYAKIMVLKAMNNFGQTRASFVIEAILYAVNNGARIINLSLGGKGLTQAERKAVNFAYKKGVTVIAAAGNEGEDVTEMGPAGLEHVIAVAATDMNDNWPVFSNWGMKIAIAAPGVDVLSLRARRTDIMRDMPGARYSPGQSYVGEDKRYYRAGGTSFSTPIASGVASLLLSKNPDLTCTQLRRMLLHSAEDINVPGFDQFTGYGLLDARAALKADPEFYIEARIRGVRADQKENKVFIEITGTANADEFKRAWIEIGEGENPTKWKKVTKSMEKPVLAGELASIPAEMFRGAAKWTLKLVTEHRNGKTWESRFDLNLE